ncbi:MAG: tetratricopeptide repeat protein [Gemmatimonadaceae bacterium]
MADTGRLDELKRKFEENPKRYFAPLANEYRKAGDAELAIELCRTYLPQQPTHMSGYIVYGQALYDAAHADESAAVFKQALTLDPENLIALRYLGDISRDSGDKIGAMRWYDKVLELDPRNEEIASYITSFAQPGSDPVAPAPERPTPPAVRPEPEPDEFAVRLEDIVSEPDVEQMPFAAEAPIYARFEDESDDSFGTEPDQSLDLVKSPVVLETGAGSVSGHSVEAEPPLALEGPWHAAVPPHEAPADASAESQSAPQPLRLSDFMPEEDAAFAPTPEELGQPAVSAPAERASTSPVAPTRDESPFVTETMAELYMQQGLRGEALGIYRQLALKRDDPGLRQRIAEIESQDTVRITGETVCAFFARIGGKRPNERVELAADRTTPLSALFSSATPDAGDLGAAQRLSGAFGNPRHSDSHS